MKMRGGSFGLVMLLIVMGIVLTLVAKNWQVIANTIVPGGHSHGEVEVAKEIESGELPDLKQTQAATDAHANDVGAALEEID